MSKKPLLYTFVIILLLSSAKGARDESSVVYQEDNNPDHPSTQYALKGKLDTYGALTQDGVTPHQISVFLPATVPTTVTATMQWRKVGDTPWTTGHDLYRIRPEWQTGGPTQCTEGYAWTIFDLDPSTSYDVKVALSDGNVFQKVLTTRALPAAAGAATKTIAAGSTKAQIQTILGSAVAGDVIQFANGTYTVDATYDKAMRIQRSGTEANPIYIRGESRDGVVLRNSTYGPTAGKEVAIFLITNANDVVIENLTLQGPGINTGSSLRSGAGKSKAFKLSINYIQNRITVRNTTVTGVDQGLEHDGPARQLLVYDNTWTGNNNWTDNYYTDLGYGEPVDQSEVPGSEPDIDEASMWGDDGITLTGEGNVAFNNTLKGFGDAFCLYNSRTSYGIHVYRNSVMMTGDDAIESDYGSRNITFYDNRIQNSMTFISCAPLRGGPFIVARNISINSGRQALKITNTTSGLFIYNNTIIRTKSGDPDKAAFDSVIFVNSPIRMRDWAFQNNICTFAGKLHLNRVLAVQAGNCSPIDFNYNSWYPAGIYHWTTTSDRYSLLKDLATSYAKLPATVPIFSGSTKRHGTNSALTDNICEASPFVIAVKLGPDHHTEVTIPYTPTLRSSSACYRSGINIVGITDGHTGANPDRGAVISGVTDSRVFGDRSYGKRF